MIARSNNYKNMQAGPQTWMVTLITSERAARRIAALLSESFADDEIAVALANTGQGGQASWLLTVHFRGPPNRAAVCALVAAAAGAQAASALKFDKIAVKDWVGESLAHLQPVAAGRFVVHGAHDRERIAANRIGIEIEAALAFGTGHHGTTRACLLALDWLCKAMRGTPRILDVGTGSGVLAIAAARALRRPVLATDIDTVAVRVARTNALRNHAGNLVAVVRAGGVAAPAIQTRAPFDLVLANILLEPLQRLAAPLIRLVAPGGRVVLSGLLAAQANAALAAYRPLALVWRIDLDGWTTLVLRRGRAERRARHAPLPLVGRG